MELKPQKRGKTLAEAVCSDYGSQLQRYLIGCLRHAQNARDLEQEVYLRLLRVPPTELVHNPQGYVYRIAAHVVHEFRMRDETEVKLPLEVSIPDFRELEFANAGFMPFLARPRSDEVCVFSAQSVRVPRRYRDQKDTENAQLASNIAYTFAVSRIAHYVKCVMRDNVGSTADVAYVTREIRGWLEQYVTRVANPDDLTLSYYPFKAARVEVKKSDGLVGKFACSVSVLPHVQFEGVDVELRLDSRLG